MGPSGNIYVGDTNNNRIQKFDSDGTYLAQWGGFGRVDGQLISPVGLAVDAALVVGGRVDAGQRLGGRTVRANLHALGEQGVHHRLKPW